MDASQICVIASALVAIAFSACPSGWLRHQGSCYKFVIDRQNWIGARTMCKWHNSDLISIETASEQKWFHTQALTFNYKEIDDGFWLGATNWDDNSTWIWEATQQPVTYVLWGQDQPNYRNDTEHCLAAVKYFDFAWSDDPCDWDRLNYVCEMSASTAPIVG